MAKNRLPKLPKAFQPWKLPKQVDPFKLPKIPKEPKPKEMHVVTFYEKDLINKLSALIPQKNLLRFWYVDTTRDYEGWRTVEPHLVGQITTTGNVVLCAWFLPTQQQIMLDGEEQKWGNYILGNISKIEVLEQKFVSPRPLYNPRDKRMSTIYCRIQ